jgi:hypothetical protein
LRLVHLLVWWLRTRAHEKREATCDSLGCAPR